MKKFTNEMTQVPFDGLRNSRFSDLSIICMGYVSKEQGIRYEEMNKNLKVIDKLEAHSDEIELEDAEHQLLLQKVNAYPWSFHHKDIVKFAEAVKNAK